MKANRLVALVMLGLVLDACGGDRESSQLTPSITEQRIQFGQLPSYVMPFDGFMWILDGRNSLIGKIDPSTNEVTETFDIGDLAGPRGHIGDMTAGPTSLWVTATSRRRIYELDPANGDVKSSIRTRGHVVSVSFLKGSLWFMDGTFEDPELLRVDPDSGNIVRRFHIGPINSQVTALASYQGSIWLLRSRARHVAGTRGQSTWFLWEQLWLIDPATNEVTDRRPLGSTYTRGPVNPVTGDLSVSRNGFWMSRVHEKRLLLMAPVTGRLRQEIGVREFRLPWEFAEVGGELWVGELNRRDVMWIDPETNERETVDVGDNTSFIGAGFGSAWVPVGGSPSEPGEVVRLTHD